MFLRFEFEVCRKKTRAGSLRKQKRLKPLNELRPRKIAVCKCDACEVEFCTNSHVTRKSKQKHHFCSTNCRCNAQKFGGVLYTPNCPLIRNDVLKEAQKSSHTPEAEQKRSHSLKRFHANRPKDWKNPSNSPEACEKRHQTMKRNGTYRTSSVEELCYEYLCNTYGKENVKRNVYMNNRWPVDFYVSTIDTYIQMDGVYWHGLDRPIKVIAEYKTKRDVQIHKKWKTDREQDEWFCKNKLKFIRLTDVEFQKGVRPCA